ncbi:MAG TPA: right-handed parallel beta-helix repeat-containing protein, partial [Candidatus Magasanikbacteria bacterium]|nr:right-handed parallel beta-helix repeat-containing protein [Candidatus Magasanikbacteria bacterium]
MTISKKILGYVMLNTCSVLTLFVVLPFWEFTKDYAQAREPVVITVTTTIQAAIDISGEGDTINVPADYASTTEVYPIDFFGHENVTFDCQNSGAIIGPDSSVTGQINMTTGTTITNCFFSNVEIISYLNLNEAADLTITNNSFDSDVTNTISVGGSGTVIINNNASLNGIYVGGDFSSSFITDNFLRVVYNDHPQGIHIVASYEVGTALISNNIIHNYRNDAPSISVEGQSDNLAVTIASNTIKYIESGYVTNFLGALDVSGTANVNYHHNYIDVSRLIINEGQIVLAQQDPGYHAPDPTTIIFNHNTVVFKGSDAAGGPKGFFVEGYLSQEYTTYITSTYNLWVNVGATSTGINAFVFAINTTSYTGNLYSDYDGYWNFENNFVDEDIFGNNTSTITNSFNYYPFFKTNDLVSDNDLELIPFSGYLDVGGPEGSGADIGAYSSARRNIFRIEAGYPPEGIDYEEVDVTSTLYIGSVVRSGDRISLRGSYYGEYEPISIVSSTFCTSSVTISGGFTSSVINAAGSPFGISITGVNSTTIEKVLIYNASVSGIKLDNSSDSFLYNVSSDNSNYGIWFAYGSENNSIISSGFSDNLYYDIYSDSNYDNILKDSQFNSASSSIIGGGNVNVYHSVPRVYVRDSTDNGLADAEINISDNKSSQNFTSSTDSEGSVDNGVIEEPINYFLAWIMSSSSPTSTTNGGYNPFSIIVSKSGYITTSSIIDLVSRYSSAYFTMFETTSTPPSDITTSSVNTSSITIAWIDNSDNEDGFVIEKSTASTSGFIFTAT